LILCSKILFNAGSEIKDAEVFLYTFLFVRRKVKYTKMIPHTVCRLTFSSTNGIFNHEVMEKMKDYIQLILAPQLFLKNVVYIHALIFHFIIMLNLVIKSKFLKILAIMIRTRLIYNS